MAKSHSICCSSQRLLYPKNNRPEVFSGARFRDLTVLGECFWVRDDRGRRRKLVVCQCLCGEVIVMREDALRRPEIVSCGCNKRAKVIKTCTKHGNYQHPLYSTWMHMRLRCYNKHDQNYHNYGGRGISICDEWRMDFAAFLSWSLLHGWRKELQIDRINNDGPYSPENCRFTTGKENVRNRRNTVWVTAFGETKPLAAWAEDPRSAVNYNTLILRYLNNKNWTPETMITTPVKKRQACR